MEIKQVPSKNCSSREGRQIVAIVNHITAGQYPGCRYWLCNPQAEASAHYVISRSGEIVQLVQDAKKAWHAGEVRNPDWILYDGTDPNRYTIGIEHEGYKDKGGDGNLTEEQYQATLWLHRQLIDRHGIIVDRDHIIGHYRIDAKNRAGCPGANFPWDRLFSDLVPKPVSGPFPDVAGDRWSAGHIQRCKDAGWMKGNDAGLFHPDQALTREQMAVILARLMDAGVIQG